MIDGHVKAKPNFDIWKIEKLICPVGRQKELVFQHNHVLDVPDPLNSQCSVGAGIMKLLNPQLSNDEQFDWFKRHRRPIKLSVSAYLQV